jgi:Extensin-like protein C-terminus
MVRGVCWYLVSSVVLAALIAIAGCSHFIVAEREPWRREAELACLNSGAVKESPARVRISAINGPGACGAEYPLRVSALGESTPLSYTDEPVRPPSSIPDGAMPPRWPGVQSSPLPPPQYDAPQPLPSPQYGQPQVGSPMSLTPPGIGEPEEDDADMPIPGGPPHPYYGSPNTAPAQTAIPAYPPRSPPLGGEPVPLGPSREPMVTGAAGPVEVKPAATLACPIVSELDQWISGAVQPAALRWFRQPVVEIKQISAYSCRGMNGDPNAHISEHAFGNALDIAEFTLADGHKVSVQYGWHGSPEEQGFLHDVQAAACEEFTTVLAPGANVYHYNHIHVDLMRRSSGRHICEPAAIPGAVAAERARVRYGIQRYGDPGVTSSIRTTPHKRALGYSSEGDDRMPRAVPGDD